MPPRKLKDPPTKVLYTNHRGETAIRTIIPVNMYYGTSEPYHMEHKWLLMCWDMDKEAYRTYALDQCNFVGADAHGERTTGAGTGADTGRSADAPGRAGEGADTARGSALTRTRSDRPRWATNKSRVSSCRGFLRISGLLWVSGKGIPRG